MLIEICEVRATGHAMGARQEDCPPSEEGFVVVPDHLRDVRQNAGKQPRLASGPSDEGLDQCRLVSRLAQTAI
jgi:hypothetical protein